MINGELSQATSIVIVGVISLIGLAGIVLGVFIQLKKLRQDALNSEDVKIKAAREAATKETKAEIALDNLTRSVNDLKLSVEEMKSDVKSRLHEVECTKSDHTERLAKVESMAKSAHKRLDEHRRVDHQIVETENDYG